MSNTEKEKSQFIVGAVVAGAAALVGGIIGYLLSAKNIIFNISEVINNNPKVQEEVEWIDKFSDLKSKLGVIKKRVRSSNWIEVQGAIIVLFAELEKTINDMIKKRNKMPKASFIKKINQAFELNLINEIENDLLKKTIPIRNYLVHGSYDQVKNEDIIGCEKIVSEFLLDHLSVSA